MTDIACALCSTKLQPETKGWLCDPCRAADESIANSLNFSDHNQNQNQNQNIHDPYDSQSDGAYRG